MSTARNQMSKHWMVTSYAEQRPAFIEEEMEYMIAQEEECPTTGRKHWQMYVSFKIRKRMQSVKSCMQDMTLHVEIMKGTSEQAIKYCSKEDTRVSVPVEFGVRPVSVVTKTMVQQLQTQSVKRVLEENPKAWRYVRQMKDVRNLFATPRSHPTIGVLLTGPTGSGKSKIASIIASYVGETSWLDPELQWFDQYHGEDLVVVDEFRGGSTSRILKMIDRYPLQLPIKGSFVEWAPEMVIFTSNLTLREIFGSLDELTYKAIERRITEYKIY